MRSAALSSGCRVRDLKVSVVLAVVRRAKDRNNRLVIILMVTRWVGWGVVVMVGREYQMPMAGEMNGSLLSFMIVGRGSALDIA